MISPGVLILAGLVATGIAVYCYRTRSVSSADTVPPSGGTTPTAGAERAPNTKDVWKHAVKTPVYIALGAIWLLGVSMAIGFLWYVVLLIGWMWGPPSPETKPPVVRVAAADQDRAAPTVQPPQFSPENAARITRIMGEATPGVIPVQEIPTEISFAYWVNGKEWGANQGTEANLKGFDPENKWVKMEIDDYSPSYFLRINDRQVRASYPERLQFTAQEVASWSTITIAFQATGNVGRDPFRITLEYGDNSLTSTRVRFANQATTTPSQAGEASYGLLPDPAGLRTTLWVDIKHPATDVVPQEKRLSLFENQELALQHPVTLQLHGDNGVVVKKRLYTAETMISPAELASSTLAGSTAIEVVVDIPALPQGARVEVVRLVQPK
ncbi:MAG: hypothetical protein WEC84_00775 [Candidatus Andersenbacteria bacterium]